MTKSRFETRNIMNLEHIVVPESKEVLKTCTHIHTHMHVHTHTHTHTHTKKQRNIVTN